ncbi:hypothetical protein [Mucilaginibacter sp.]
MKYSDWKLLTNDEKRQVKLRHRPPVRIASIFFGLFLLLLLVVVYKTLTNRTVHVNRNPTADEAYAVAKQFVQQRLKLPQTAVFPHKAQQADVDTEHQIYQLRSSVKSQETNGKQVTANWAIKLLYTGGDWEDQRSWQVKKLQFTP